MEKGSSIYPVEVNRHIAVLRQIQSKLLSQGLSRRILQQRRKVVIEVLNYDFHSSLRRLRLFQVADVKGSSFLDQITVKVWALVALPPLVVIAILPVLAPAGTTAVTCVSELTEKLKALTPPKVTAVV